jgi:hypothetical protein
MEEVGKTCHFCGSSIYLSDVLRCKDCLHRGCLSCLTNDGCLCDRCFKTEAKRTLKERTPKEIAKTSSKIENYCLKCYCCSEDILVSFPLACKQCNNITCMNCLNDNLNCNKCLSTAVNNSNNINNNNNNINKIKTEEKFAICYACDVYQKVNNDGFCDECIDQTALYHSVDRFKSEPLLDAFKANDSNNSSTNKLKEKGKSILKETAIKRVSDEVEGVRLRNAEFRLFCNTVRKDGKISNSPYVAEEVYARFSDFLVYKDWQLNECIFTGSSRGHECSNVSHQLTHLLNYKSEFPAVTVTIKGQLYDDPDDDSDDDPDDDKYSKRQTTVSIERKIRHENGYDINYLDNICYYHAETDLDGAILEIYNKYALEICCAENIPPGWIKPRIMVLNFFFPSPEKVERMDKFSKKSVTFAAEPSHKTYTFPESDDAIVAEKVKPLVK